MGRWSKLEESLLRYICQDIIRQGHSPEAAAMFFCIKHQEFGHKWKSKDAVLRKIKKNGWSKTNKKWKKMWSQ